MNKSNKIKSITCSLMLSLFAVISLASCGGDDGDAAPFYKDIQLNSAINETIPAFGTKVYRMRTIDAGNYTISLTNLTSDLGWTLTTYDPADSSLNSLADNIIFPVNGDQYFDTSSEIFTEVLSADTYYYIVVDEWDDVNSSYTLQIIH